MAARQIVVSGAAEGFTDRVALVRLVEHMGLTPGMVYDVGGKTKLLARLHGYNNAAHFAPWVVLVDLDRDAPCPPPFVERILPQRAAGMVLRVVVRELESWLLASTTAMAAFIGVPATAVPSEPDKLDDAKRSLVTLASRSRRSGIRKDMVPRPGAGRQVGPAYASRIAEFIQNYWDIDDAASRSPSLAKCVECLRALRLDGR